MQNDHQLQVSVVPDEDASIHNFNHYNTYLLETEQTQHHEPDQSHSQSQSRSGHVISDPFAIPASILPPATMEQWAPPNHEMGMSGAHQLPSFNYGIDMNMGYTGSSPAPMMAQGNTTPSSKSPHLFVSLISSTSSLVPSEALLDLQAETSITLILICLLR